MKSLFSIEPFGGVDEIGSNMTLIATHNYNIIIDVGILFPYEDFFDINYLIPDFSKIEDDKELIIIFTHGHEDHIGASAHFFAKFPHAKAYAPAFAKALIHKKLAEANLGQKIELITEDLNLHFDNLEFSFVHVNHSIPDTYGVLFRDNQKVYSACFISDFKVDLDPVYEKPINFSKIIEWYQGHQHKLFFADSTNILNPSKTPSEKALIPALAKLIAEKRRTFITLFASNIHRIQSIYDACLEHGKKLIVVGRSTNFYIEVAKSLGHLPLSMKYYDIDQVEDLNAANNVFIISGCQGDFRSALRRFAFKENNKLKPTKGDLFVFSSKTIPGNEKKVNRVMNELTKAGVDIITASDELVHASGHPAQEDLKIFIDTCKPNTYFPIHGESFFLERHFQFIKKFYPHINPILIHNFEKILFSDNEIKIIPQESHEPLLIHGKAIEIERERISERRKLATLGSIFISFTKENEKFSFTLKGLPSLVDEFTPKVESLLLRLFRAELRKKNDDEIAEEMRIYTRRFYNSHLGYKPVVIVHIC